jgi:hypothetical protein
LRGTGVRAARVWFNDVRKASWLDYEGEAVRVSGAGTEAVGLRSTPGGAAEVQTGPEVRQGAVRTG